MRTGGAGASGDGAGLLHHARKGKPNTGGVADDGLLPGVGQQRGSDDCRQQRALPAERLQAGDCPECVAVDSPAGQLDDDVWEELSGGAAAERSQN